MSDALDLLLTRRSVKAIDMVEPAPDDKTLRKILTAAARVPDHGKLNPWRFVLFEEKARKRFGAKLAAIAKQNHPEMDDEMVEAQAGLMTRAPLVVAVVFSPSDKKPIPEWEQVLSCGAACQNLLVATHAAGFVGQWLTGWPTYDAGVMEVMGLKPDEKIAAFIHIGSMNEKPTERPRPELDLLLTRWAG
ncbi:MAG: nitroreductase family protein [Alphaproteobacteria bacterium]